MLRRKLSLAALMLLILTSISLYWLTATPRGLTQLSQLAGRMSNGQLAITPTRGSLLGRLELASASWTTDAVKIHAEQIILDWSASDLLAGKLQIKHLHIGELVIDSAENSPPNLAPDEIILPLAIDLADIQISRLRYGKTLSAEQISGQLSSDGTQHQLNNLKFQSHGIALSADATLNGKAPLQLGAKALLSGQIEQHPLALSLTATGPLQRLILKASASAGISGDAEVELTPFASTPFSQARVSLQHIDPAAWQPGAPKADLTLQARFVPQGEGVTGDFHLSNLQPGPLDRSALPLSELSGQLFWQGETAKFEQLHAKLGGKGELQGNAQWQNNELNLKFKVSELDAAQLATVLRWTRLKGQISARLGGNQQTLAVDLADATFSLRANAQHQNNTVTVDQLELSAGNARLSAKGEVALDQTMAFKASGELHQFDPSRFAKTPAAQINARLNAQGKLHPRPLIDLSFDLKNSRLASQPLNGKGQLSVDWPAIPKADITLTAGPNQVTAQGAFGRPQDTLAIVIEAPRLAPYGVDGNLSGRIALTGNLQHPQITTQLKSDTLHLAKHGRIAGLSLNAQLGGDPASPLNLDLKVANIERPEHINLGKNLHIEAAGSNQSHQLRANFELTGKNQIDLALQGGIIKGRAWQGWLREARLSGNEASRNFQLAEPAEVHLSADSWRFGPARLSGLQTGWEATLQGNADARQMAATLKARGKRLGQIDGQFSATPLGAWNIAPDRPWQASLKSETPDLAWLAELIGEEWQTAGHFSADLSLTGTPAKPVVNGRFRGDQLALRLPGQGLNLNQGELAIDLDNNILRVKQLHFASQLQAPPRALRLSAADTLAQLIERPGRLEVSGEMMIDRHKGADNAFLDIKLDRFGISQLSDQWLLLSGNSRLTWQDSTLGVQGKLGVDAAYWQLAPGSGPKLSDDVIIKRTGQPPQASSFRPRINLDITTDLGKNFLFQGAGLNSRLAGEVRLRASGRDLPRATGSIRTRDGKFDAYGQKLEIERGILTFQGLIDNPALDVKAVRKGLTVEPGVQISGTALRPVIKLISDPELPDSEKLAWLVLGHGPEQMSAGDATILLSAAGGLLGNNAGGVVQQLKQNLGIDEFGIRQGNIGDNASRQPSSRVAGSSSDTLASTGNQILSVGKRLSSNTLLSYEQTLGKAESIVKLTVSLSRQISLIGRAGSDNAVDIFYTFTFGRPERSKPGNDKAILPLIAR